MEELHTLVLNCVGTSISITFRHETFGQCSSNCFQYQISSNAVSVITKEWMRVSIKKWDFPQSKITGKIQTKMYRSCQDFRLIRTNYIPRFHFFKNYPQNQSETNKPLYHFSSLSSQFSPCGARLWLGNWSPICTLTLLYHTFGCSANPMVMVFTSAETYKPRFWVGKALNLLFVKWWSALLTPHHRPSEAIETASISQRLSGGKGVRVWWSFPV